MLLDIIACAFFAIFVYSHSPTICRDFSAHSALDICAADYLLRREAEDTGRAPGATSRSQILPHFTIAAPSRSSPPGERLMPIAKVAFRSSSSYFTIVNTSGTSRIGFTAP